MGEQGELCQPGIVVLLFGTSSVGKTSLASALQTRLSRHFLLLGLDAFFRAVSPAWGGGRGGPLSREGFHYRHTIDDDGEPLTTIGYGPVGNRVLTGMHDAVAALARAGNDVIFDDMPLDLHVLEDWARALRHVPALIVKVTAPLDVIEQRERDRGGHRGLARAHYRLVDEIASDTTIDTTTGTPEVLASRLAQWIDVTSQ